MQLDLVSNTLYNKKVDYRLFHEVVNLLVFLKSASSLFLSLSLHLNSLMTFLAVLLFVYQFFSKDDPTR